MEFVLLQLLEKEVMDGSDQFSAIDSLIARIDAYMSLAVAADTF